MVEKNEELVALEAAEMGKVNAVALQKWQDTGTPGWGLEEKIQLLDEVLTGVWNLGESGSRYTRVVGKFERWLSRCQDVLETHSRDGELLDEDIVFLERLDSQWKDDCSILGRKLQSWADNMKHLGSLESGSSLATAVNGCWDLVRGMLMELATMEQIERDALAMELEWIRSMNDDTVENHEDVPVAGAVWRRK